MDDDDLEAELMAVMEAQDSQVPSLPRPPAKRSRPNDSPKLSSASAAHQVQVSTSSPSSSSLDEAPGYMWYELRACLPTHMLKLHAGRRLHVHTLTLAGCVVLLA